jgi:hypothetical protein
LWNEASVHPPANRSPMDSQQSRCLGYRESFVHQLMHHDGLYVKEKANPDERRVKRVNPGQCERISQEIAWEKGTRMTNRVSCGMKSIRGTIVYT